MRIPGTRLLPWSRRREGAKRPERLRLLQARAEETARMLCAISGFDVLINATISFLPFHEWAMH